MKIHVPFVGLLLLGAGLIVADCAKKSFTRLDVSVPGTPWPDFQNRSRAQVELSDEMLQTNDECWSKAIAPMIGNWLTTDTPIADVIAFDRKAFYQRDFSGFTGDRDYVQNRDAFTAFAWDRSNIANLYVWRMNHATNLDEKNRMAREADFAFRQALALNPRFFQTVDDYKSFLKSQNRDLDVAAINKLSYTAIDSK